MLTQKISAISGTLGAKLTAGDLQMPEGFYKVVRLNPLSRHHLSLGINYPNEADIHRTEAVYGKEKDKGGEIFLHGGSVTVGCIPLTDDGVEPFYIACLLALSNGYKDIPVHIFPCHLSEKALSALCERFSHAHLVTDYSYRSFFENLATGYRLFEESRTLPIISVDPKTGCYLFE